MIHVGIYLLLDCLNSLAMTHPAITDLILQEAQYLLPALLGKWTKSNPAVIAPHGTPAEVLPLRLITSSLLVHIQSFW